MFHKLDVLHNRLEALGIQHKFACNFPWVYITEINNKRVVESFDSDHGFVVGYAIYKQNTFRFAGRKELFKLVRKYCEV